jgi:hypothetical protein
MWGNAREDECCDFVRYDKEAAPGIYRLKDLWGTALWQQR